MASRIALVNGKRRRRAWSRSKFPVPAADSVDAMASARPLLVCEVMTTTPTVLHATHSVGAARHLFDTEGYDHLPVIRGRKLVGILSARDVREFLAREPDGLDRRVGFAVSRPPVVVRRDAPVAEAVRLLTDEGIHCLPVIDQAGDLLGVLTIADLLSLLARVLDTLEGDAALRRSKG